jgi:hypothetical protein
MELVGFWLGPLKRSWVAIHSVDSLDPFNSPIAQLIGTDATIALMRNAATRYQIVGFVRFLSIRKYRWNRYQLVD